MKKLIILILVIVLLTSCSCRNKNNIEFNTKEEILSQFSTYELKLTTFDIASNTTDIIVKENDDCIYYQNMLGTFLIDKKLNKTFTLYESDNTKEEFITQNITLDKIKNMVSSYILAHLSIDKNKFEHVGEQLVGNILCDEYKEFIEYKGESYSLEKLFISKDGGYCVKRYIETKYNDVKTINGFEITELSFDNDVINNKLNNILNTGVKIFKSWPNTTLGSLVTPFDAGVFVTATDNSKEFYTYFNNVDFYNVTSYTQKIVSNGFNLLEGKVNEDNIYQYITYNKDEILVKIKYNLDTRVLTIRIIESTMEQIEQELASLDNGSK